MVLVRCVLCTLTRLAPRRFLILALLLWCISGCVTISLTSMLRWGAQGAEPAKQLWNLLFDRLTNHHGIHNLIWMWNSLAVDWYPGSSAVDILSADAYAEGHGVSNGQNDRD